jgi:DNA-binding beta-propeller fold protein YncE
MAGAKTKIGLAWVPRATIKGRVLADVLFAVDPATNGIVAFPNASRAGPAAGGITVFRGKPVNLPNEVAVNPLNGDLIVTDLNDNNLVEINPADGRVVGTRLADNAPVDLQTGNGSALIGLAATTDGRGNRAEPVAFGLAVIRGRGRGNVSRPAARRPDAASREVRWAPDRGRPSSVERGPDP